jgi:2,3-bisphosphoglycerate-dependent phosphoglycerate mutase
MAAKSRYQAGILVCHWSDRPMPMLVLIRHGQSAWNLENRFTGWWDVDVTEKGAAEAKAAGELMKAKGLDFDQCFTSVQKRAIKTLNLALEAMDRLWLPVEKDWHLNERHYGGLTGLDKAQTAAKHGDAQVKIWRRSFDVPPPPLEAGSEFDLSQDRRYAGIAIPATESLKDTIARVLPYWESRIAPELRAGKRVLISAHGNSLRALVKHLSGISDDEITGLEIPTGQPIVYDLADDLSAIDRYYLSER